MTHSSGNPVKVLGNSGGGLHRKQDDGNLRRALQDRLTLAEAIEAATWIVDAYPNGGKSAGKSYLGALAATLAAYPKSVALACADVRNGIVQDTEFLPTVAGIVKWCEQRTEKMRQHVAREDRVAKQIAERQEAEAKRAGRRLTYDELKAKYGDGKGGWGTEPPEYKPKWAPPSADELRKIVGDDAWNKLKPSKVETQ